MDNHLSRCIVAYTFKRIKSIRLADSHPPKAKKQISLQPAGFTFYNCHQL